MPKQEIWFLCFDLACLLFPWVFAYLHSKVNRRTPRILFYFRYFMSVNVFNVGVYTIALLGADGYNLALMGKNLLNPILNYYVATLYAMVVMSYATMYGRRTLILAAPTMWFIFLLLNIFEHIAQVGRELTEHIVVGSLPLFIHLGYYLAVVLILLGFIITLKQRLAFSGVIQHGR